MHTAIVHATLRRSRHLLAGVFLLLCLDTHAGGPDEWKGSRGKIMLQNWSVNLNIGLTSYYGDLSQYDVFFPKKMLFESLPAFGFKLTKYLHPLFGISGQVIYGGFRSDYLPEHPFKTRLLEYNFQLNTDIMVLAFPGKLMDYGLEIYAGMGQFLFHTTVVSSNGDQQEPAFFANSTPEFVYFCGGELYYKINQRFRMTADLAIRQAQNDNIDKYIAGSDFDYYSWFSVGLSWSINSTFSVKRYKARIRVNEGLPVYRR